MLNQASKVTGLGLAALVGGLFVAPACGGDDNSAANTGGAGTGGTGKAGAGNGGSSNGGSSNGGSGGSSNGGSGGGGSQVVSACPGVVPTSSLVTDFTALVPAAAPLWGTAMDTTDFYGGLFNYPAAITNSVADDMLTASGNVADYSGFGLYVAYCADASSFDGVKFKISGDAGTSGNVLFSVQTNETKWADGVKGSCLAPKAQEFIDCVPPSKLIMGVTDEPQEVTILWSEVAGGKPTAAAKTDGSDIIGFQWSFAWVAGGTPYDGRISIDDLEFVGESAGGTGAGGAPGGAGAGGASDAGAPGAGGAGGAP